MPFTVALVAMDRLMDGMISAFPSEKRPLPAMREAMVRRIVMSELHQNPSRWGADEVVEI